MDGALKMKTTSGGQSVLKGSDLRPTLNHCFLSCIHFQLEVCCCFFGSFFFKEKREDLYGF